MIRFLPAIGLFCLTAAVPQAAPAQTQSWQILGQAPGAPALEAYLIQGTPFLPLKRYAADAGYKSSVSPSGKSLVVIVRSKSIMIVEGPQILVDGKEMNLTPGPVLLNSDIYLPLEFYTKVFPERFEYNSGNRQLSVFLRGKSVPIPLSRTTEEPKRTPDKKPERGL